MNDLMERLRNTWNWLKATPGVPSTQVRLTAQDLVKIISALEVAKVVVKFPDKE
jgi:hypothetical protein